MYERSAIVLERYFENYLDYRRECNLRDNFNYYCELVLKLEKYQINYQKEYEAIQEYNNSLKKIKSIQVAQEKLYKKSAKLEYNRNMLFNSIDGKPEELRRCIEAIEEDVEKNSEEMKEEKEKLLAALVEYNDKKFELSKCKRYKKMAENDYNEIYEIAKNNFDGITQENIDTAKDFAKFDENNEIIEILEKNGKDEKIPFNIDVITEATFFGVENAKNEVVSYLAIYDKMERLLADIEEGSAKIELHKKYLQNEKAKIDFIYAVKDYIVQFLDYERMTVIHGRKSHNRLMSEACESFHTDVVQINNLYELLIKEIANKATKKAYRDLYNKSYLTEIKEKEEKFKKEKNRVNLNTATLINSNYWRIEGIKSIYTVFYKNVSEVFGKTIEEFDIPKEFDEDVSEDNNVEVQVEEEKEVAEEKPKEKVNEVKMPFKTKVIFEDILEELSPEASEYDEILGKDDLEEKDFRKDKFADEEDDDDEDFEIEDDESEEDDDDVEYAEEDDDDDEEDYSNDIEDIEIEDKEDFDIFGEKYKEIDFSETSPIISRKKSNSKSKAKEESFDIEDEEDDIFKNIKKASRKRKMK